MTANRERAENTAREIRKEFDLCIDHQDWLADIIERAGEGDVFIPFSAAPCGHSSQYCYTVDGGKNIVCLVCEHENALRSSAVQGEVGKEKEDAKR